MLLEEMVELRQVLPTKHISIAEYFDSSNFSVIFEAGISETPPHQVEVVHLKLLRGVVVNQLRVCSAVDSDGLRRDESIGLVELVVE